MHDPQSFKVWSAPLQAGLIGASRKVVHDTHAQQHACAQPINNRNLTPTYADVTLILMPSVTLSLLQSCMCICSDSILRAPNACTALKIGHRVTVVTIVAYVPNANLAYQFSLEWQCLISHKYILQACTNACYLVKQLSLLLQWCSFAGSKISTYASAQCCWAENTRLRYLCNNRCQHRQIDCPCRSMSK
jgi:hypothetical protein